MATGSHGKQRRYVNNQCFNCFRLFSHRRPTSDASKGARARYDARLSIAAVVSFRYTADGRRGEWLRFDIRAAYKKCCGEAITCSVQNSIFNHVACNFHERAVVLFRPVFNTSHIRCRTKFLDSLRIHVKGGTGGTGLPKYGGLGGQGGCVYCIGKENVNLKSIMSKYRAQTIEAGHGEDSRKTKIVGAPGADIKLEVPLGMTIYREDGKVLGQINEEGEIVLIARGGPGGNPQNGFLGHSGQKHHVRLDLKLIADVGFVGFPNAGKSSLLKALSRAKPRVASYPFTTIKPNLGIMQFNDLRQITLADLPGLIEGAHINIGLGHKFLKHVERTKLLLFITDIQGFKLSPQHTMRTCFETIVLLNKELELYNPELLEKPAILAINKMDLEGSSEIFHAVKQSLENIEESIENVSEEIRPEKIIKFKDIIVSCEKKLRDICQAPSTAVRLGEIRLDPRPQAPHVINGRSLIYQIESHMAKM
ncbi:GTP-binding protein 10 homolog [Eumeta japonica]|uniref:GTP-binding protein 10 homolog n=1 Tax=Eumeta variegata TaxID=151549 RepID=A0A4C1X3D0_EUMVA|nr:GTP-binding protein 10 homolog [Eumeta japonica]